MSCRTKTGDHCCSKAEFKSDLEIMSVTCHQTEDLINALKLFQLATEDLSGKTHISMSLLLPCKILNV